MSRDAALADFRVHLKLERSLSDPTVEAYVRDLGKLQRFAEEQAPPLAAERIELDDLQHFVTWVAKKKLGATSQARLLSAVRAFYRSLRRERIIQHDPTELLESPRMGRYLTTFLTVEEIESIILAIDMSAPMAHRDRAIVEVLYGCGLRVSELCGLQLSRLSFGAAIFLRRLARFSAARASSTSSSSRSSSQASYFSTSSLI